MMSFRNYTGHVVSVFREDGSVCRIEPEGSVVAEVNTWDTGMSAGGVPIKTVAFTGAIDGMPDDLSPDDRVVVGSVETQAFPEDAPVVAPGRLVRHKESGVIGARGFRHISPVAAEEREPYGFASFGDDVEIVNLTQRDLDILDADGNVTRTFEASGTMARPSERRLSSEAVDGFRVDSVAYGNTIGLPEPEEGRMYIVGEMVALANAGARMDLVTAHDLVREDGHVIGARSLAVHLVDRDMNLEMLAPDDERVVGPMPLTWDDVRKAEGTDKEAPVFGGDVPCGTEPSGPDLMMPSL